MMMMNVLNQEAFDLHATNMTYLKLFNHILKDFVSRADLRDLLIPNNMVVQVTVPPGGGAGVGGVVNAIANPSLGPTFGAIALKTQKRIDKELGSAISDNTARFLE